MSKDDKLWVGRKDLSTVEGSSEGTLHKQGTGCGRSCKISPPRLTRGKCSESNGMAQLDRVLRTTQQHLILI